MPGTPPFYPSHPIMNITDHLHALARAYPGGVEAMAHRLGKSPHTLRHEFARQGAAKLSVDDADAILAFAIAARMPQALQSLHAQAAAHGAMLIELPQVHDGANASTMQDLAVCAVEFAEFVAKTAKAADDGVITANELNSVDKELGDLITCAQSVRKHLAQWHETGKPEAERKSVVVAHRGGRAAV